MEESKNLNVAFPQGVDRGINVPMVAGVYYDVNTHGLGPFTATALTAAVAGKVSYMPILITKTQAIDRIGVETTTASAGGTTCRVGIYRDNGGVPGALVAGTDSATIATDAIAVVENTIAVTLVPGWYWLANTFESTPTMRAYSGSTNDMRRIGYAVNTAPTGLDNYARVETVAYAALGANAGTTTLSATAADWIRVFIRAA